MSATGQLANAVSSGSASIADFYIAPRNTFYVLFENPVDLTDTSSSTDGCLLAQVDAATGAPTCIDSTLASINWQLMSSNVGTSDPPIQFDDNGDVYYSGITTDGESVLRKYANGSTTDLITQYATIDNFLVLDDGSVIISGGTPTTGAEWVRLISPDGSVTNLVSSMAFFVSQFPDGNIYFGTLGGQNGAAGGVQRYLTAPGALDPEYWIRDSRYANGAPEYFDAAALCPAHNFNSAFCGGAGATLDWAYDSGQDEFVVVGDGGDSSQLMEYYPQVRYITTQVANVTVALGVIDDLIVAGTDANGANLLTLLDPSAGTERTLIGAGDQVEIYHLAYRADDNSVLFDGLRFSDNAYVIGEVDLSTGAVTFGTSSAVNWTDLQSFGGQGQ